MLNNELVQREYLRYSVISSYSILVLNFELIKNNLTHNQLLLLTGITSAGMSSCSEILVFEMATINGSLITWLSESGWKTGPASLCGKL